MTTDALHRLAAAAAALAVAGCATRAVEVRPIIIDGAPYAAWSCDAIHDEADRVQRRATEVAYAVDERAGNNLIALGLGLMVFWPALIAMRPDGPDAVELAQLKGRHDALQAAAAGRGCASPADAMAPQRAKSLPIVLGERLVYEERRAGERGVRQIGLELVALRRNALEFTATLDGRALSQRWVTDLQGNVAPHGGDLLHWSRLLKAPIVLGDTLAGELHAGHDAPARVRGLVVAVGAQSHFGRAFDAAVIELAGDAQGPLGNARVDGVMVVDRASGVLLRLELRSANADFALRRTLLRVVPAPG